MITTPGGPPNLAEIECSIFGPGYGECVALHLGDQQWVIIDSCIETPNREPVALTYLRRLGVDPSQAVKCLVLTHWHDDHCSGFARLVEDCVSAEVWIPEGISNSNLFGLAGIYRNLAPSIKTSSGVKEFTRAAEILLNRSKTSRRKPAPPFRLLKYGMNFFSFAGSALVSSLQSLSPSDQSIIESQMEFAQLYNELEKQISSNTDLPQSRIPPPESNRLSVGIFGTVGSEAFLLGADLEKSRDNRCGWPGVFLYNSLPNKTASFYKVAHHGSKTGHCDKVWDELLISSPIAILTPFNRKGIPNTEARTTIFARAGDAYMTARSEPQKSRRPDLSRHKLEDQYNVRRANRPVGQIRLRKDTTNPGQKWQIELSPTAFRLTK